MKKLLRWIFELPTTTGATKTAGCYARYAGRYMVITTVISTLTALGIFAILLSDPAAAPCAAHDLPLAMNAGAAWIVAHQFDFVLAGVPVVLAYPAWSGRGQIVSAYRAVRELLRVAVKRLRDAGDKP
jgi:hypothetical protein